MNKLSKENNRILQKLRQCNNEFLVKDVLKIILVKQKHQKHVLNLLKKIGMKRENPINENKIINDLKGKSNVYLNKDKSIIYYKRRSIGCKHCVKDLGCTIRITDECNRKCFFCFVSDFNKKEHDEFDLNLIKQEIEKKDTESNFESFAISGGEPFLYPKKVFKTLEYVNERFNKKIYTRVYTNGDFVTESILKKLNKLNLDEIRYSVKPLEKVNVDLIKQTKKYIPQVLIEMPVLPDSENFMKELIYDLTEAGVDGINLLELFFNGKNIDEFKKRGYKIDVDETQIRELCDLKPIFEYPVYGSRILCLKLIKYFANKKIKPFINFCSQKTKQLQYVEKKERIANKNLLKYSQKTKQKTHKILVIYSNIDEAKKILKKHKINDFYIKKERGVAKRIETNVKYLKYFIKDKKFLLMNIFRDPGNNLDIDFELINIKDADHKQKNFQINKLINSFDKLL